MGYILYLARRYDESLEQLRKAVDMDANFCLAHSNMGWVYEQKKMFAEAVTEFQKALALCGDTHGEQLWLAHAYALAGQTGEARRLLAEFERSPRQGPVRLPYQALVHLVLGDKDRAFDLLKRAIDQHAVSAGALRTPAYDALHSDPRCASLLRGAGFAQ